MNFLVVFGDVVPANFGPCTHTHTHTHTEAKPVPGGAQPEAQLAEEPLVPWPALPRPPEHVRNGRQPDPRHAEHQQSHMYTPQLDSCKTQLIL